MMQDHANAVTSRIPELCKPVGLPLVTNGPDNANANNNINNNHWRGRCGNLPPE
ncbi:MAG: hypothetical protein JXA42_10850 [Anaerolineales bacterium]|nr:hypothetical protein [Anaerolineales bacterium]